VTHHQGDVPGHVHVEVVHHVGHRALSHVREDRLALPQKEKKEKKKKKWRIKEEEEREEEKIRQKRRRRRENIRQRRRGSDIAT